MTKLRQIIQQVSRAVAKGEFYSLLRPSYYYFCVLGVYLEESILPLPTPFLDGLLHPTYLILKKMKHKFPVLVIIIGAIFLGCALFAFRDQSLTRLQQADTIRIGYAIEAPFAFLNSVAKEIVARVGIQRIEWVQTDFGSLIASGL